MIALAVLSAAIYAYTISGSVKVAPKQGCSSCPSKDIPTNL
jgi:hypothetical protein